MDEGDAGSSSNKAARDLKSSLGEKLACDKLSDLKNSNPELYRKLLAQGFSDNDPIYCADLSPDDLLQMNQDGLLVDSLSP